MQGGGEDIVDLAMAALLEITEAKDS